MGIFSILAMIVAVILIYLMVNPDLAVEPVATNNPATGFGTAFDLNNKSVATLNELSSSYCVNSFHQPDGSPPLEHGALNFGAPTPSVSLASLPRGETAVLPLENVLEGPAGSEVDLVFVVRFQPGWWINQEERRYRFVGTERQDNSWSWKEAALGSPCG